MQLIEFSFLKNTVCNVFSETFKKKSVHTVHFEDFPRYVINF